MGFNYDKIKNDQESGSQWASYSDLFMVLSLVFLLLYVVSSLRSGTFGIQQTIQFQQVAKERDDLKQQIKVYSTLKENYLQTGSTSSEQATYKQLMGKLDLLKEEAKTEKEELQARATENAQKEVALNKYQQMVRNIINANMVSAARRKRKDRIITAKNVDIKSKKQEINKLQKTVVQKQISIEKGEQKIARINKNLNKNIEKLEEQFRKQKISRSKMQQRIQKLKASNGVRVSQLEKKNKEFESEIEQYNSQLSEAQDTISQQSTAITELVDDKQQFNNKIAKLKDNFNKQKIKERKSFLKKLKRQKLSAKARARKEAEFIKQAKAKQKSLSKKVSNLESKAQNTQEALDIALAQKNKAESESKNLKVAQTKMSSELKRAQKLANAKKNLIKRIQKNLTKSGLKAQVDKKTGDVIINFGEEYFDTGKASLKSGMKETLKKFMPMYSKSLFADPKTAKEIGSVEIIGYASPTYKGKFVDPVSLSAKNKEAVNYNLDLSYYRARSIFDYIFDTNKIKYNYQKSLLPKVKVTGRSFLADGVDRSIASGMTHKQYCKQFDCKKAQRVIIRFNLGK